MMLPLTLRLLKPRIWTLINGFTQGDWKSRSKAVLGAIVTVVLAIMVGLVAWSVLRPMAEFSRTEFSLKLLIERLPSLGLFSAFWMLLASALGLGLQVFYQSYEMSLLLSTPIRTSSVFLSKFIEAALYNSGLFLLLSIPISIAYGAAREILSPGYLITAFASLIAFACLPTCLGLLTSMGIMRILPAGRFRETLTAVGVALIAGLYFYASVRLSPGHGDDLEGLRARTMPLSDLTRLPIVQTGPWGWAGETFFANRDSGVLVGLVKLLLAGVVAIGGGALAADRLFRIGWLAGQDGGTKGNGADQIVRDRRAAGEAPNSPFRAMLLKDLRTLVRDSKQLTALLVPIAVVAVLVANAGDGMIKSRTEPLLVAQALLLVLSPVCLRIATGAFAAESTAFWLMLVAPNGVWSLLLAKLTYAAGLAMPIGLVAAGAFGRAAEMDNARQMVLIATAACAIVGFSSIGVFGCAAAADFREGAPRFGNSVVVRMILFTIQIIYLISMSMTFGFAFFVTRQGWMSYQASYSIALAVVFAISATLFSGGILIASRRLSKAEWGI